MRYVILIIDRRAFATPCVVAKPYLDQRTTRRLRRAAQFRTQREARRFLGRLAKAPHRRYLVARTSEALLIGALKDPRKSRPPAFVAGELPFGEE